MSEIVGAVERPILVMAAVILILSGLAVPASAGNHVEPSLSILSCRDQGEFGSYWTLATPCNNDSSVLTWSKSLGPRLSSATWRTLYESYDTTDIVVASEGSHTSSVDVYYGLGDLSVVGAGVIGYYYCKTDVSGNTNPGEYECDHAHVVYDNGEIDRGKYWLPGSPGWTDPNLQSLACHETGHSFGLLHPADGNPSGSNGSDSYRCMQSGTDEHVDHPHMGPHNADHLDDVY